jgi:hypothetical protein
MPFFFDAAILSRIRSPRDLALELGEGEQHIEREPAHAGGSVERLGDRDERHALRVKNLDDLGEIRQRSRQPIDLVDDDHVDLADANVVQHPLQRRAIHRAAGIGAVVVEGREGCPTLVLLARDIGLAGFALRIERVELLLEALLRRFAGVDGAAEFCARRGAVLARLSHWSSPRSSPRRSRRRRASPKFSSARRTAVQTIGRR